MLPYKFTDIIDIKNRYYLRKRWQIQFYNVSSFSISLAVKAKTDEKPHNLWTIGHIYEASLQVVIKILS